MLRLLPLIVVPLRQVAAPILARLGTAGAVYLVAQGVPTDTAQQVFVTLGVLAGLTTDVIVSIVRKQSR